MEVFLTAIGTVLGTAALLFYRDWRDGKKILGKNGTAESAKYIKELRDSQLSLQQHFNDETTVILKEMRDCLSENNRQLFEHMTEEKSFQRDMRDFMRDMRSK